MKTYLLVTSKPWHDYLFKQLEARPNERWHRFTDFEEFKLQKLLELRPEKIFIPHWSFIIPKAIWQNYECIVFHMTDLPYGRGGSPLQNLIIRGHNKTVISALRVNAGLDTGDIYVKKPLSLEGNAQEIFERSAPIIQSIIEDIIENQIDPKPQEGEVISFKRRKPEEGKMNALEELKEVFNYIRMLDAEGYPSAYIETGSFKLEFSNASFKNKEEILANVRITKR